MAFKKTQEGRKREELGGTHLCELQRANSNFLSKLGFNPVLIHTPDDSENVSLQEPET